MKECIFCRISGGEIPCSKIYEDEKIVAFLDAFPCAAGQTLVIPKKHIGYFIDMRDAEFCELMIVAKKIAKSIQKTFSPIKVGIIIEGLEIGHVHVKLYPLPSGGFSEIVKCKPKIPKEEMQEIAAKIKRNL